MMKDRESGCESREAVHRRLSEIEVSHELLAVVGQQQKSR